MNKKSSAILNLMAFSSLICLSGPVMAATAKSDATPALQISDAPWSPPGPPVETASAAQTPALEISDEIWQPQQSAAAPVQTPVSEKTAVPPPALYVPGSAPVESQPVPQKQPFEPLQQAKIDVQLEKPGTVSEPQAGEDLPKIQAQESRIDSLAAQNAELESKLKSATAPASAALVAPPSTAKVQASIAPVAPPANAAAQTSIASAVPAANTQVLKTLQDQIDTLAKDNAELQQKLKTASATPAPASSRSAVVASSDFNAKIRVTKPESEQMHVVKFNMKDDDAELPALAPASGGPIDSAVLPGKNDPAPVKTIDVAPIKASPIKDDQPLQSKAQSAPGGTWQAESVEATEPAQASEIGKLKKRYEMSEAENAKLGDMVKVVKDQCDQEKGQMQKMLFDPQIADEQQRAYITDLEHQLGESQQALAEQKRLYDLQIRLLKSRIGKRSDS